MRYIVLGKDLDGDLAAKMVEAPSAVEAANVGWEWYGVTSLGVCQLPAVGMQKFLEPVILPTNQYGIGIGILNVKGL